jgi:hypothetical protein
MEQRTNQTQVLGQIIPQQEEKNSASFKPVRPNYDHITLTEQEEADIIDEAIYKAKSAKAARLREIEYANKLNAPRQYPIFTFEALKSYVLKKNPDYIIDDFNREVFETLCMYFAGDPAFELQGEDFSLSKGIILYGGIGCGKTRLMKVFAVNTFRPFAISSCRLIADEYQIDGVTSLYRYSELQSVYPDQNFGIQAIGRCFDDIGTEDNKSNFGNKVNVMQDIIYKIYDNGLKGAFHGTTNLTGQDLKDQYGERIASRMSELFNVVVFDSNSPDRRK